MKIVITHKIPDHGIKMLEEKGYEVVISPHERLLTREELIEIGKGADAVLTHLTDKVDGSVIDAWGGTVKIVANYAVGYDNFNVKEAQERGVVMTNTPDVLTNTVAEHTFALLLAIAHRISEADRFSRSGQYTGWKPMLLLGSDMSGKTLGILGLGRIGSRVAYHGVKGFGMKVLYYDVKRNEEFEKEFSSGGGSAAGGEKEFSSGGGSAAGGGAEFRATPEEVLREADFVSIHVPLLDSTKHLINAERLRMMKKTAYIVNTSRGPVVDEEALRDALKEGIIKGAALDVWEHEPQLTPGLAELENIILTPHIASATEETRQKMGEVAAKNIIEVLEGRAPINPIRISS